MNTEKQIQREIRRRAFDRAEQFKQTATGRQYTRYTIDALEDVTGLPRLELENIANEVRTSYKTAEEKFFSIKNQLLITGSILVPLFIFVWLAVRLI